jgi:uncharacterized protein
MSNRFARIALIIAAVVLVAGALAWGVAQAAPPRQGAATPTPGAPQSDIGVSGTVFGAPDTAIALVGVDLTGPTLTSATSDASTRMSAVLDKIKSLGVDAKDITTVSYSVTPITSNPKEGETPRITGYHVSNIVQVKIRNLDNLGTIIDAAIGAGANSLNNLYFTINDPTSLQQQARTQAVQNAMAKAKTLANAAGVKLGPITSITENVQGPRLIYSQALAAPSVAGGVAPGPVETGQSEIDVTVEMHFQIAQ